MKSHVTPPKLLPLHIVGWLSLPWRHWIYLVVVLGFGLCFLMFSPAPFLVRLLVLVVPLLTVFLLTWPIGGLHLDEWLMLAMKFRLRTKPIAIGEQEEQQLGPDLEELLRLQDEQEAAAAQASLASEAAQPGGGSTGEQIGSGVVAHHPSGVFGPQITQIDLAGSYGVLHRSYAAAYLVDAPPAPAQLAQIPGQKPSLAVRPPPSPPLRNAGQPMSNAQLWKWLFTRLFSGLSGKQAK
jgi:hypothetical protein